MTRAGVQNAALDAIDAVARRKDGSAAPGRAGAASTPALGTWMTPMQRDPIEVPLEEKIALLLRRTKPRSRSRTSASSSSGLQLLREVKTLVTSEGTNVTQTFIRVGPYFRATAIATGDFQTYEEELAPRGQGWEYIESLDMPGNAERWASIAAEKLSAKSVEAGPVRPDSRADEPVADDSRVDRTSHGARSRGRPGSQLRRAPASWRRRRKRSAS